MEMKVFSDKDSITVMWTLSTNHSITGLHLLYGYANSAQNLGLIAIPPNVTNYTISGLPSTSGLQFVVCIECTLSTNATSRKCEVTSLAAPSTASPISEESSKRTMIIVIVIPILAALAIALLIVVICRLRVVKSRKAGDRFMERNDSEDGTEAHLAQGSQKVLLTDHAKVQSLKHTPSTSTHVYSLSKTNRPPSSTQKVPDKPMSTVTFDNTTYATRSHKDQPRNTLNRKHSPASGNTDYNSGFASSSAIIQTYDDNPEDIILTAVQQGIFDSSEDLTAVTQPQHLSSSELSLNDDVTDFGSTSNIIG